MPSSEILGRLADIEMPPLPSWTEFWLVCAVVAVSLAMITGLAVYFYQRYQRSPPPICVTAQEKLMSLFEHWKTQQLSEREVAFRLATLLRLGLGQTQLRECPQGNVIKQDDWLRIMRVLNEVRYTQRATMQLSEDIFHIVGIWLQSVATDKA